MKVEGFFFNKTAWSRLVKACTSLLFLFIATSHKWIQLTQQKPKYQQPLLRLLTHLQTVIIPPELELDDREPSLLEPVMDKVLERESSLSHSHESF